MSVTPERVFIYGTFKSRHESGFPYAPAAIGKPIGFLFGPDIAVEILREFSATELVGKIYVKNRTSGGWSPVSQPGVRDFSWYKGFPENGLVFDTEGSGPWEVLYFRPESDESGPYVAVGLKLTHRPTSAGAPSQGSLG